MRRIQLFLFALVCMTATAFGQYTMIDNFDHPRPDTVMLSGLEAPSTITFKVDSADKVEGGASMNVQSVLASKHSWGTYTEFGQNAPEGEFFNWSTSESLSVWIKVKVAPTKPENLSFRFQFTDQPNSSDEVEYWDYENSTILDNVNAGWVNLRVSLKERVSTGSENPDSTGFIMPPTSWGLSQNNQKFDLDKIVSWRIVIVTATLDADSMEVSFDKFERFGTKAVPVTLFNGLDYTSIVTNTWAWGQSAISIEKGAGITSNTNAIKWVQGNEWGNGWSGWGFDMTPTNMMGAWTKDSLQFKMKAESGVDTLRVQFESADGVRGIVFKPTADGAWHTYKFKLSDMLVDDGKPNFDTSAVNKFGLMAQATAIAGKVVYITDLWTGNPVFDVIPPDAPTGVAGTSGVFVNIISWTDVPNEPEAKYNVYFSENVFTDFGDSTVEDLPPYKIAALAGATNHVLRAPLTDQSISYYYGVTATDGSGNVSPTAVSGMVTTTAKGVPVINNGAPANYATNAALTEWTAAGIAPFNISKTPATGEGHVVTGGLIDNDADLFVKAYIAMDASHLYVAFDVVDDIVSVDSLLNLQASYAVDCPDLFIGLYDWRGKRHNGYKRGATPDYHLRFSKYGLMLDNPGNGKTLMLPGADYAWKQKSLTPGYIIEAKIPFQVFVDSSSGDVLFTPQLGKRIPVDFSVNDNDGKTFNPGEPWNARDGILCYSQFNDDNSWQDMWRWSHTWVGPQWKPTGVDRDPAIAAQYELSQNYPNPFNPSTQIRFTLTNAGQTTLKVYDVLGRTVATLVDGYQSAGTQTVQFDGQNLASGIYFYKIESGSFSAVKKMMFIK
ncbi:MAG: T9SS type A sorting domain-containing protein [Bacteroidota bacterium]